VRVRDITIVQQGPKIRLGQMGKSIHNEPGKAVDDPDVVSGIVLLRKGADADKRAYGAAQWMLFRRAPFCDSARS
jgi:cobalt-zinc-cadmium resistance protein CzcA